MLISMNAVFWLGFAIIVALGGIPGFDGTAGEKWILAGMALGAAVCLAVLAFFLARRKKAAFYTAVTVLTIILVLSFTDQVGLWDVLTMLSILVALVLLLKDRKWYLDERKDSTNGSQGDGDEI
jgi:lysylphosphatidylglycerol synthetase-like protein (DUF2156 family)